MAESVEIQVLQKIKHSKRGVLYFTESFLAIGKARAVSKALERLAKAGEIKRVATGIYVRPIIDSVIGPVSISIEEIASAIAKRDKARIIPSGVYALNKLGLSTQVPLNVVYLTDGAARKIKIGKRTITFKKTTPRNLSAVGNISGLVIQALRAIGKNDITKEEIEKIHSLLRREKNKNLEHDIPMAPDWIRKIMYPILNENK